MSDRFRHPTTPSSPTKVGGPGIDLQRILRQALDAQASDIHFKPGRPPIFRINGALRELEEYSKLTPQEIAEMAQKMMTERQLAEYRENHEVDLAYSLPGIGRFRTNVYQQRGTVAMAMRAIPTAVQSFDELHLPEVLQQIADCQRGMILVTGTTGCGKSTTLAAMIEYINSKSTRHIVTIEDPIEFLMRDKMSIISQREVGFDTNTFSKAIRSALRQDPDVIFVGEMRDTETITTALQAAETGHLVLSTLHTIDVIETINRILSFYMEHQLEQIRFQLASSLRAIVSQRLMARADGQGRVPAVEVMVMNSRIRDCILHKEKTHEIVDSMEKGHSTYGMQTFDMSLMRLVLERLVSYEEAMRSATNPGDFALKFKGVSSTSDLEFAEFSAKSLSKKKPGKEQHKEGRTENMVIERFSK